MAQASMFEGGGDSVDTRQIMFTNLQVLGLDAHDMEKTWRIPFNKDMFDLPNKKGFEAVMYFLFERLNSTKCKETFRCCWKVQDKKDEHQFRKICFNWLSEIAENDKDAQLPRFVASFFMSPGGHRFIHLLLHFSRYVLQRCIVQETNMRDDSLLHMPRVTAKNITMSSVVDQNLRCGVIRHRQRFVQHAEHATKMHDTWANYSGELVRQYRGLKREIRELEHQLRAETQLAVDKGRERGSNVAHKKRRSGGLEYDFDLEAVKRNQKVRQVRDLKHKLSCFQTGLSEEKEVLSSVLNGEQEKYCIDSAELNVKVPERLLREQHKELLRRNVENVYQGGKLNLLSLIQLWNLSLHLYIQKFDTHGVPNFSDCEAPLTTLLHTHNARLSNTQALSVRMEEMIPHLKESIEELKRKLDKHLQHTQTPESIRISSIGLGLLPPTPPISFDPTGRIINASMDEKISKDLAQPQADNSSTPEAASQLMAAIDGKVTRRLFSQHATPATHKQTLIPTKLQMSSMVRGETGGTEKVGNKQRTRTKAQPTYDTHSSNQQAPSTSQPSALVINTKVKTKETAVGRKIARSTRPSHQHSSPVVQKHENTVASFVHPPSPSGHAALADMIAQAMMSEDDELAEQLTEQLKNPATLMGEEAFVTRSKIQFSPPMGHRAASPVHHQSPHHRQAFSPHLSQGTSAQLSHHASPHLSHHASPHLSQGTSPHLSGHTPPPHKWQKTLQENASPYSGGGGPLSSTLLGYTTTSSSSSPSSSRQQSANTTSNSSSIHSKQLKQQREDTMKEEEEQVISTEESDTEIITISPSPKRKTSAISPAKSPKASLYHQAQTIRDGSPPRSSYSSPHVTSHFDRSSITESPMRATKPRNGEIIDGLDGFEGPNASVHTLQDNFSKPVRKSTSIGHGMWDDDGLGTDPDLLDLSGMCRDTPTGQDSLEDQYLNLISTDTPKLNVCSRSAVTSANTTNNAQTDDDNDNDDSVSVSDSCKGLKLDSMLTMTPSAGRKFAKQSSRIAALEESDKLSQSRSKTPDEEDFIRQSLTGESDGNDDVKTTNSSDNESLNNQMQQLLRIGLARESRLEEVATITTTDSDDNAVQSQASSLPVDQGDNNKSNNSSSSDFNSLIERYKRLREPVGKENKSPNRNHTASLDSDFDAFAKRLQASGLATPPKNRQSPIDSSYLERTPTKTDQPRRIQFSLDLSDEEEGARNTPPLVTRDWLSSGVENRLLGGGLLDDDYTEVLNLSPFQTPTATPKGTPKGTPQRKGSADHTFGLKFSSLPMSPLTDALHKESIQSSARRKLQPDHFSDIFGEDASLLVPSSP